MGQLDGVPGHALTTTVGGKATRPGELSASIGRLMSQRDPGSRLGTARLNGLNVEAYPHYVLGKLPEYPVNRNRRAAAAERRTAARDGAPRGMSAVAISAVLAIGHDPTVPSAALAHGPMRFGLGLAAGALIGGIAPLLGLRAGSS